MLYILTIISSVELVPVPVFNVYNQIQRLNIHI